ncbi:MAG: ribbon-helix-helix protein, CopG family [Vicinamibacterales bacterium]
MRTTVRLDDELLERLKAQARSENVSLTRLLNRALRAGLKVGAARRPSRRAYRERVHPMGAPRVALDKALALAGAFEDEDIVRELTVSK